MITDTNNLISITEANQNFSKITKHVDENGPVIILKNNKPKYAIIPIQMLLKESSADYNVNPHRDILEASKKLLQKNKEAYKVLANEEN